LRIDQDEDELEQEAEREDGRENGRENGEVGTSRGKDGRARETDPLIVRNK
jgi:hypothetical protein